MNFLTWMMDAEARAQLAAKDAEIDRLTSELHKANLTIELRELEVEQIALVNEHLRQEIRANTAVAISIGRRHGMRAGDDEPTVEPAPPSKTLNGVRSRL